MLGRLLGVCADEGGHGFCMSYGCFCGVVCLCGLLGDLCNRRAGQNHVFHVPTPQGHIHVMVDLAMKNEGAIWNERCISTVRTYNKLVTSRIY